MGRELLLAAGYAGFLACCAALLSRSATALARETAPDGGKPPWPQSDAVALRRVLAGTLLVLACFILSVAAVRAALG
jgi:hypothetical protein